MTVAERATLGKIEGILAGRAQIEKRGDPIVPWVKRTARILMDRMGTDPEAEEKAEEAYRRLLEDARAQASLWRGEGREDLAHRLSILVKSKL